MSLKLSKTNIVSFQGDVLPLHLGFDGEDHDRLAKAKIMWFSDSDAVTVRAFSGENEKSFNNGVLLVLNRVGTATVTAVLDGAEYSCEVIVREPVKASSEDELQYYIGDLHDHTTRIHNAKDFAERTCDFQCEYINFIKQENMIDFSVISDHGVTLNDTDFFRGFTEVEKAQPMEPVIFPGSESEVTVIETDRFGVDHKNSGEIVVLNADGYTYAKSWEEFRDIVKNSPEPVAIFAHPLIIGISVKGIWNFCFNKNNDPEMLRVMRGVEMGSGSKSRAYLAYEFAYSDALDNGFRVSNTCASDSHGPRWGYNCFNAKTVIMAKEKSKEAFIDALRNNRFYGTESGNIKLRYTVNGMTAPCDLPKATNYKFHVELSYFKDDETTRPINCKVICDNRRRRT